MTADWVGVVDPFSGGVSQIASLVPPGTRSALVRLAGFALLAAVTGGTVAALYRRLTTRKISSGTGVLAGLLAVSLWLTVRIATSETVVAGLSIVLDATGYFLLATFGSSAVAVAAGRRFGDTLACEIYEIPPDPQSEETAVVRRSARRAVSVELPDTIRDRSGSEPVDLDLRRELEGSRWWFPSGLSAVELESRLRTRLERDYGISRVEIELAGNGNVKNLAIGYEPSGLSATLPPRTVGVAVRTELLPAAAVHDPIELWTAPDDCAEFAGKATLHATTTDSATLVLPEHATNAAAHNDAYRCTTKPAVSDDVADLLSVLREADHTIDMLSIEAKAPLEGEFVGWLPVSVLVIVRDRGVIPLPDETETLRTGDDVYVFGGPGEFHDLASFERERQALRET